MTPKQHQFAREIVLGKSQADAYRTAYDTLRMNDNSIRREASRLMDNPNVATTVVELQQEADAVELMGKHYGLFTERIEAVVPERSSEEIQIELEAKLQQFLLPEAG